jgi:hypothetical protein
VVAAGLIEQVIEACHQVVGLFGRQFEGPG